MRFSILYSPCACIGRHCAADIFSHKKKKYADIELSLVLIPYNILKPWFQQISIKKKSAQSITASARIMVLRNQTKFRITFRQKISVGLNLTNGRLWAHHFARAHVQWRRYIELIFHGGTMDLMDSLLVSIYCAELKPNRIQYQLHSFVRVNDAHFR